MDLPEGIKLEDVEKYQRLTARCWLVVWLLASLPLEALDEFTARGEVQGPALYPDIWRAKAEAIMQDREMIRTMAKTRRDLLLLNPMLTETVAGMDGLQLTYRTRFGAMFRDWFTRREFRDIPPLAVLDGLVRYVAMGAPAVMREVEREQERHK